MNSKIGVHYIPIHGRPGDIEYIQRLQPRSIKIVDPDPNRVADIFEVAPNSLYVLRNHPISEQKKDVYTNPEVTGKRHARELSDMYDDLKQRAGGRPFPEPDQTLMSNVNELTINEDWQINAAAIYNASFCQEFAKLGKRGLIFNFSVGWPKNHGPDMPADWTPFEPVYKFIKQGNHMIALHEYWAKEGPQENWLWWAGRYLQLEWDVPIIIGEFGVDEHVKYGKGHVGWRKAGMSWEQYMDQIKWYDRQLRDDTRVHSAQLFTTDYGSSDWENFDTQQLHDPIVQYDLSIARQDDFNPHGNIYHNPIKTVETKQQIMYVAARDGLNIRQEPRGKFIEAIPFGEEVAVYETRETDNETWARIGDSRWVAEWFLSLNKPEIPTEPVLDNTVFLPVVDSQDKFTKTMNFIFKWEGGLSADKDDPGNYVNGKFVGTKYGISAKAHQDEDIVNLTKERAAEIYKKEYWEASGADKMPWPLCLAHMNLAVNGGVSAANLVLSKSGQDFNKYMGEKIKWYTNTSNWNKYYTAWMRRCADLLIESTK